MTRITGCGQMEMFSWVKEKRERIKGHAAWRDGIDAAGAEEFLRDRGAFTYLLREGDEENGYFISFVKEDLGIKHQRFTLEYNRKGWYYKNGTFAGPCQRLVGPEELIAETLEELIPRSFFAAFAKENGRKKSRQEERGNCKTAD